VSTPAPRRISPWWWVAGGCAALLVLTIVAGVLVFSLSWNAIQQRAKNGGFSCLPSDLPGYPGARFDGESFGLNENATPGNFCEMKYRTSDSADTVLSTYPTRLNGAHWYASVSSTSTDEIDFFSTSNARHHGVVKVTAGDGYTEITIDYYSP
jgi:hypothetical protein